MIIINWKKGPLATFREIAAKFLETLDILPDGNDFFKFFRIVVETPTRIVMRLGTGHEFAIFKRIHETRETYVIAESGGTIATLRITPQHGVVTLHAFGRNNIERIKSGFKERLRYNKQLHGRIAQRL